MTNTNQFNHTPDIKKIIFTIKKHPKHYYFKQLGMYSSFTAVATTINHAFMHQNNYFPYFIYLKNFNFAT